MSEQEKRDGMSESPSAFVVRALRSTASREVLVEAVKREWDGRGVDSAEPYITNGASRAVIAALNALELLALEEEASS